MAKQYYVAVTYDLCDHYNVCEPMNEYVLNNIVSIDEQIDHFAKQDIAPLVKLFCLNEYDSKQMTQCGEYKFKQYECHCEQQTNI